MVSLETLVIAQPFLAEMEEDLFLPRSILEKTEKWMRLNCDTTTIAYAGSICTVVQGTNYGGNQVELSSPWLDMSTPDNRICEILGCWRGLENWMQLGLSLKSSAGDLCCFSALTSFYLSAPKIQSATSSAYIRVTLVWFTALDTCTHAHTTWFYSPVCAARHLWSRFTVWKLLRCHHMCFPH